MFAARASHVSVAHIIGQDDQDIGRLGSVSVSQSERNMNSDDGSKESDHGTKQASQLDGESSSQRPVAYCDRLPSQRRVVLGMKSPKKPEAIARENLLEFSPSLAGLLPETA
jgi:hypothetical protein